MLDRMKERVNADAAFVQRGRWVSLSFLFGIDDEDYKPSRSTKAGLPILRRSAFRPIRAPLRSVLRAQPGKSIGGCRNGTFPTFGACYRKAWRLSMVILPPLIQNLQYFKDVIASFACRDLRDAEFETITGRYFTMQVAGKPCRIYVEEAGEGIPLVCLHTAGSDARQYRHLLCDKAITDNYRVIAFDMPWHGKSNPPAGFREAEYKLTTDLYKETVMAFCCAYELVDPVVMGVRWADALSCIWRWSRPITSSVSSHSKARTSWMPITT